MVAGYDFYLSQALHSLQARYTRSIARNRPLDAVSCDDCCRAIVADLVTATKSCALLQIDGVHEGHDGPDGRTHGSRSRAPCRQCCYVRA